jgi:hypothetical protein
MEKHPPYNVMTYTSLEMLTNSTFLPQIEIESFDLSLQFVITENDQHLVIYHTQVGQLWPVDLYNHLSELYNF